MLKYKDVSFTLKKASGSPDVTAISDAKHIYAAYYYNTTGYYYAEMNDKCNLKITAYDGIAGCYVAPLVTGSAPTADREVVIRVVYSTV